MERHQGSGRQGQHDGHRHARASHRQLAGGHQETRTSRGRSRRVHRHVPHPLRSHRRQTAEEPSRRRRQHRSRASKQSGNPQEGHDLHLVPGPGHGSRQKVLPRRRDRRKRGQPYSLQGSFRWEATGGFGPVEGRALHQGRVRGHPRPASQDPPLGRQQASASQTGKAQEEAQEKGKAIAIRLISRTLNE